jgi:hypothetical protein
VKPYNPSDFPPDLAELVAYGNERETRSAEAAIFDAFQHAQKTCDYVACFHQTVGYIVIGGQQESLDVRRKDKRPGLVKLGYPIDRRTDAEIDEMWKTATRFLRICKNAYRMVYHFGWGWLACRYVISQHFA